MAVALATTHHDPDGRLYAQTARMLPRLEQVYTSIDAVITPHTQPATQELLCAAGVRLTLGDGTDGYFQLGRWRRLAVERALHSSPAATHIHFCDFDRLLHWAEYYWDELQETLTRLQAYDFTILSRTATALASHPRVQRDTETLVNHIFGLASGHMWDVTAAARGLSRLAAQAIVGACRDDTVGTDCSWPLFILRAGNLTMGCLETEGLEFETLDRHPDEIAALGGPAVWKAHIDDDPRQWARRLDLARVEVQSVLACDKLPANPQKD
ncbi:MAG: hypothetical protein HYR71_14030 [Chloroflexi bacterium]|nr:hypothetical protein [Chloroflexota bacterium]